jgi:serine protease AprX
MEAGMFRYFVLRARLLACCATLWLALLAVGSAFADTSKISPDLLPLLQNGSNKVKVIVQYTNPPQNGGGLLGGILGGVLGLLGGVVDTVFSLIPAVAAILSPADVLALSDQSDVSYVSLDRPLHASLDYTAGATGASLAWTSGFDGTGVGIAIIDSGIYPHGDLQAKSTRASRVVYRQSFVDAVMPDDYGHGTHVAGIAAGNGRSSSQSGAFRTFRGIAPNAQLIDLRVLDKNGESSDSVVIHAIERAVQLKSRYNIRIINLSLGRPIYEGCSRDPLCQAVESAWKAGIVVVTAAGNLGRNGYATILSPGDSPRAITVGAIKTMGTSSRDDDQIASYSSKGPTYIDLTVKPDLVAPGNLITSLLAPGSTLEGMFPGNVVAASSYTSAFGAAGNQYFETQRNEHGRTGRGRRRGVIASAESDNDTGSSEGSTDEDCL